jgi:LPPG:FO 2-phospho-L-lactate transferase
MSDDPVTTRITVVDEGEERELHFQEYWVRRRAAVEVKSFRFDGVEGSAPAPGVLEAVSEANVVVVCPSNPVVSVGPILAVPGVREAVAARRDAVVGVSPIVGGAPVAGMADKLMPVAGLEVSALGAARAYEGLLGGWVIDDADRALAGRIAGELGLRVEVTDTIMRDDGVSEALARTALDLVSG